MAQLTHLLIVASSFFLYESCFTMVSATMPARETLSQECSLNSFSTDQQSNKITGKVVDVKDDPIIGPGFSSLELRGLYVLSSEISDGVCKESIQLE